MEHGSFSPLIFFAAGGMSPTTTVHLVYKGLNSAILEKNGQPYFHVLHWIRCHIGSSLLKHQSCARGEPGPLFIIPLSQTRLLLTSPSMKAKHFSEWFNYYDIYLSCSMKDFVVSNCLLNTYIFIPKNNTCRKDNMQEPSVHVDLNVWSKINGILSMDACSNFHDRQDLSTNQAYMYV